MIFEYQAVAFMSLFFLLAYIPASAAKVRTFGIKWLAGNRDRAPQGEVPVWGARAERAHANLKDNFPAFAAAILVLGSIGGFNGMTKWLAGVYIGARVVHFVSYCIGHAPIRSVSYFFGLGANVALIIRIFNI